MKKYKVFVPVFLIMAILFCSFNSTASIAHEITNKVLRLHILANSDSNEDQNIKLKLRDYFLCNTEGLFSGKDLNENIEIANSNIDNIQKLCDDFLMQYNQKAKVSVTKEFFNTRVYDDFTLPAGNYNTVKIEIGEGTGHNWWCIVFPSVCIPSSSASMDEYMTDDELELINSNFTPKFKVVEIYERIKEKFNTKI